MAGRGTIADQYHQTSYLIHQRGQSRPNLACLPFLSQSLTAVGAKGAIPLSQVGWSTAPGQSFQFSLTLRCKSSFPACPCPSNTLPQFVTLLGGDCSMGSPPSATSSPCQASGTGVVPPGYDPMVSISEDGNSAQCYSAPVQVGSPGIIGTVPSYYNPITWDDGRCHEITWFQVTNFGRNSILPAAFGPVNVHLTGRYLAGANNSNFLSLTGPDVMDFDITSFGGLMEPSASTYFSLVVYCKEMCPCSQPASFLFRGTTLSDFTPGVGRLCFLEYCGCQDPM